MRRRKGFQEVALSLTEPGHMLLAGESTPPQPTAIDRSKTYSPKSRRPTHVQVTLKPRASACIDLDPSSLSGSTSTMRDLDSESLDLEAAPKVLLSAISTPAQIFLASAASKNKRIVTRSVATVDLRLGKELTLTDRVEGWERSLKDALKLDSSGNVTDALAAYSKINRQVTREAILEFEKMNYDQKKLMNNVMNCLDKRCMVLKAGLRQHRPISITSSNLSAGTMSTQLLTSATSSHPIPGAPPISTEPSYIELQECLKHFPTIKVLSSNRKMPVTLIYQERHHRKAHKFQEKGKSNKVTYSKEKREFLQIMGLPGKMITPTGLDFNMRPEIDSAGLRIQYSPQRSRSVSAGDRSQLDNKENNGGVVETVTESTDKLSLNDEKSPTKAKRKVSAMNILKKQSVSPHPTRDNSTSSKKSSGKKSSGKKKRGKKKDGKQKPKKENLENRSMLSCDSCSSSDEYESESDVTEQDVAVPSNYEHAPTLQPEPFYGLDLTFLTFDLEKIGIQNTVATISPFLRITMRDKDGDLVEGTTVQETAVWDVVNKNYLRAPGSVHLPLALEALPDDIGIFLELVHHRPHLNCLSTHCYAYLDKDHLREGEFVCELYYPPVDFSRTMIRPYSEKALFLHFKLILNTG